MATVDRNLSEYNKELIPDGSQFKIGIVISEWNSQITDNLAKGAIDTLISNQVKSDNIHIRYVRTFELPLGAQYLCEYLDLDGVIAIGTVIQGETKHFDYVCEGATKGLTDVNL